MCSKLLICVALVVCVSRPIVAPAQSPGGMFGLPVPISAPITSSTVGQTRRLRLADVIGTPHPDIVRTVVGSPNLEVVDLHAPAGISITTYPVLVSMAGDLDVGDLNDDGVSDVAIATSNGLTLVTSSPGGLQTTHFVDTTSSSLGRPFIRDVNGDGFADVVLGFRIFENTRNVFTGSSMILPNHPGSSNLTIPGDFDGDGDVDFMVRSSGPSNTVNLQFLRADGSLMTVLAGTMLTFPSAMTSTIEVADLDGDLIDDFCVWYGPLTSESVKTVSVYRGVSNGNPTLHSTFQYRSTSIVGNMLLRDVDGDGDRDIVLQAPDPSTTSQNIGTIVTTLMNDGAGHIAPDADHAFLACNGVFTRGGMDLADLELDGGLWAIFHHVNTTAAMPTNFGRAERLSAGLAFPSALTPLSPTGMTTLLQPTILPLNTTVSINGQAIFSAPGLTRPGGGFFVSSSVNGSTSVAPISMIPVLTDFDGRCAFPYTIGSDIGAADIALTTATGLALTRHYGIGDANFTIVSGDTQTAPIGQTFPAALVVRTLSTAGVPLPGTIVTTSTSGAPVTLSGGTTHVTGTDGTAMFSATAGATSGAINVSASILPSRDVTFSLSSFVPIGPINPQTIDVQVGESTTAFVRLLTPGLQPLSGVPVAFGGDSTFVTFTSNVNAATDANGIAGISFLAGPNNGMTSITASSPIGLTTVPVRVTGVTHVDLNPQLIGVRFIDSRPDLPVLIAFDLPLPQPIPTSVGVFHTSILHPSIYLQSLDGIGYFGFQDPTYRTDSTGTWFQIFFVLPGLDGVTVVTQVYGYDVSLPFPQSVTVSNAVYRTF